MMPIDAEIDYAFWTEPESSFKVTYSLGLFHEIDFQVNEGYRRIPHGGIETGGLLFGRPEANAVRIEAFRSIECEHASGPSFILSDRDVSQVREQLKLAKTDPELQGLDAVGWFIAHTRSPLRLNDREIALFNELFPGPRKIALLIKPERFQPTRFGFLVRGANGQVPLDATDHAIILPLPGRAGRSTEGPVASIPAPAPKPAPPPSPPPQAAPEPRPAPDRQPKRAPEEPIQRPPTRTETPVPEPSPSPEQVTALAPISRDIPAMEEIRRRRARALETRARQPLAEQVEAVDDYRSNLRLAAVLFFAAALGCAGGYWAYLQLPSPTIALTVQSEPSDLLVSWPPDQTRNDAYAAIRVNDGQQVLLTRAQKRAGEARINPGDNVKVEVIAPHWMRDSRGIVRFIKPQPAMQPVSLGNPPPPAPAVR